MFADLVMLRLLAALLRRGISVKRLKAGLKALYASPQATDASLVRSYVVTDGKALYFCDRGVVEALESGQLAFAFVLELETLRTDVSRRVARLAA